jgi:branched-chain amino acid transport system permease protein
MSWDLALLLAQDGLANGAIYVLVALGIVLLFLVTRVIFVPFGDLVAYTSLTLAALQAGQRPGTIWLDAVLVPLALAFELGSLARARAWRRMPRAVLAWGVLPAAPVALAGVALAAGPPAWSLVPLTVLLVLPIAPLLWRIAFAPIAEAPVLLLLIVSVVLHFAISGVALICFGPEGMRPTPLLDGGVQLAGLYWTRQSLLMLAGAAVAAILLFQGFGRSYLGRALRATALNRTGARLVGIRPRVAGVVAFLVASLLAVLSGLLIGPVTTLAFDSGFVIGLKAFVGAIIGGLVSYPGAVLGALFVGQLESFTAFWNSALKDAVVFAVLVPILLARSFLPGTKSMTTEAEEAEEL